MQTESDFIVAFLQWGYKLYEVKDITVDREKLENLIRLCNQEQLSLLHLRDVVEDFLTCL